MPKTIEDMMGSMTDPATIELNARYQNAREAVAWAYKMAQERAGFGPEVINDAGQAKAIAEMASYLVPFIEAELNKTLDILKEKNASA